MRTLLTATLAAALIAPAAQAFTAINGLAVNPVDSAGRFEVISRGGDGPRQIWCAAAEFAREVQGVGNTARLYVAAPYGSSSTAPGLHGVTFTARPDTTLANGPRPGTDGNYSVRIRQTGFNLRLGHALGFCDDVYDEIAGDWPL